VADKLLFLDFDGVLHPNHCDDDQWFSNLNHFLAFLDRCPEAPRIVVSSSWRFHYTWDELLAFFPERFHVLMAGTTGPVIPGRLSRFREIQAYLDDYRGWEDWRALDDCAWEFPDDCPQLIRCDGARGLDDRALASLAAWLRGTT
jgi:hypothetical protein